MPLDFQIVQAPMRLGLAEGVEPHQAAFGTLTRAENACWSETGLIQKRLGSIALPKTIVGGGSIASASRLIVRDTELALTDGTNLYSRASTGWVSRGLLPNVGIQWETARVGLTNTKSSDSNITSDGLIVEAWVQGDLTSTITTNALMYRITEQATGTVVTPPTTLWILNAEPQFRVLTYGTQWFIVYMTSTRTLRCQTSTGGVILATNTKAAAPAMDAIIIGSDFVVAYSLNGGGIALVRASAAATPVVAATGTVATATTAVQSISLAGPEALYITWAQIQSAGNAIRFAAANPSTLVQTVAPLDVELVTDDDLITGAVACARLSSTSCLLTYQYTSSSFPTGVLRTWTITNAGVTANISTDAYGVDLLSKHVVMGGRFYVAIANVRTEYGTDGVGITADTMLVDVSDSSVVPRQVGKVDVLTGTRWPTLGYVASARVDTLGTSALLHMPFQAEGVLSSSTQGAISLTGSRRVTVTTGAATPLDMWRSLSIEKDVCFAAGVLGAYDGREAIGYGWSTGPLIDPVNTVATAVGGLLAPGDYLYNLVAERRSGTGLLYRSPVALDYKVTTVGVGTVNRVVVGAIVPSIGHSVLAPGSFIFYRSVVSGSITQRIGFPPKDMVLTSGVGFPATVTDNYNDGSIGPGAVGAKLAQRPALYTIGGELEDTQPPSALTLAYHQNRIWMISGDGSTVWLSKDRTTNPGVAPGFHPVLTFVFDRPLTALASMDEKLVVFAADTFWAILGQGPAPNGQNGSYEVVRVQTDVGCTNPRSVVSTPDGIIFQGVRGLYLLTRSLELNWLGRPIKDELESYPDITSAVLVAAQNEIRFTATGTPDDVERSIVLVYNYVERQWTTSKYTVDGVYGHTIADACMWQGRWTAVTTTGTVFYETESSSLDAAADASTVWVPMTIETAWVNASGPLSFQSVRNFSYEGVARSPHSLTIDVGFDSDPSYPQTATFSVTVAGADSRDVSIGTRRKCHAIRFRLTDAAPVSGVLADGTGLSLAVLGIEVGLKKGFSKKPVAQTG